MLTTMLTMMLTTRGAAAAAAAALQLTQQRQERAAASKQQALDRKRAREEREALEAETHTNPSYIVVGRSIDILLSTRLCAHMRWSSAEFTTDSAVLEERTNLVAVEIREIVAELSVRGFYLVATRVTHVSPRPVGRGRNGRTPLSL